VHPLPEQSFAAPQEFAEQPHISALAQVFIVKPEFGSLNEQPVSVLAVAQCALQSAQSIPQTPRVSNAERTVFSFLVNCYLE
jgi:hypothetical protein